MCCQSLCPEFRLQPTIALLWGLGGSQRSFAYVPKRLTEDSPR